MREAEEAEAAAAADLKREEKAIAKSFRDE